MKAKVSRRSDEVTAIITDYFRSQSKRMFKQSELRQIWEEHATEWKLPRKLASTPKFIAFLEEELSLKEIIVTAESYNRRYVRYSWGDPRPYELAVSLGKQPYLSHASAMFLHGLTDQIPKTIYINDEQTPKNFPPNVLTQEAINRAFAGKQRTSNAVWVGGGIRVVSISGKNTERLEVGQFATPEGFIADTTKIERTLIDIAVRPDYAGGPYQVRDAYAAARGRISSNVLVATLKKLNYLYPYHQVIGFYMSRAGFEPRVLEPLRRLGFNYDFHLTYGMKETVLDPEWRLFVPKGF